MTRRERKEARLARRLAWAAGRDQKAAQGFKRAASIAGGIPSGSLSSWAITARGARGGTKLE